MRDFIKILKRFVPPYKRQLILSFIFNILSAFMNVFSFALIIPILGILFKTDDEVYHFMPWNELGDGSFFSKIGELFSVAKNNFYWYSADAVETYGEANTLLFLAIALVVMTLIKTGVTYLSSFYLVPIRTGVVRDLRNQINDKILSLPLSFFSEERKGDIIGRMTGDVGEVENSIMSSLDMFFKNPILILVYFFTMLAISWQLTVFVIVLLPISGIVMGRVGKKLKRKSFEAQNKWGELMAQIEETLGGLRIIKAFNAEGKVSGKFHREGDVLRSMSNRIARRQQLAHPMSEFLGTATIAVVLWYGGTLILGENASITAPSFIYYLVIFYSIINPAKDLSKSFYSIQKGLASMERIDKILLAENNILSPEKPVEIKFNEKIEYRDVWFEYRENAHWVIKNVSLTVPKGKTIALVGQSGSGKSTMVDLLPRFYDVQKGGIFIDGVDIRRGEVHQLRSLMGNVNQEAILFNDTFFNNITFGVESATMEQVVEAAKIANAHDFIIATENGYDTNIGDRGGKLSGGQRQRISIARAILKNPQILILDEATSALDTESERLVQDALENLMKNRTTIVIAHRLSTIKSADEICVMHEGEIVERGHHDELHAKNGYYRKLCDMQNF
ncbi:subfamily B ATP-binding cassette protein MsbA [Dysgonomonas sp. PH5-45]|uniref:ABC transporter ATP-binding protein n=1 Tax=unclassified Dysgonomonas TaxID=2630389 RepID=UPI0024730D66|nr:MULTISPECIES: ABC transporter ATP-binding protein [unclassified Dysgonomonas]MDH6355181.1 subfamily B ATP-binding cassette protein MsbA [Dysgonomonas sp. PH5-45]MDH6388093.1 subfamily B ATP-binding cassette protein MsbA [Dysgonomonas sp. PH5-37]